MATLGRARRFDRLVSKAEASRSLESGRVRAPRDAGTEYICECANSACFETITLTDTSYREIRAQPTHFVLLPGHELEDIERVTRREPAYLIVEKLLPVPPVADVVPEN